ncbi:MAG: hypothetical protein HC897_00300 [Thermoanaerobaculia bacterium]|nr:hypothetical protein [Thermoanaerobaculia bacterium]
MLHVEKPSKAAADWTANWSWAWLVEVLALDDAPERIEISRILWKLQVEAFQRLRRAIEDESSSTSWDNPFTEMVIEFPVEWDTEKPLSRITSPRERKRKALLVALETLTHGIAWQLETTKMIPVTIPIPQEKPADSVTQKIRRCFQQSIDPEASMEHLCLGDRSLEDKEDRTIIGWGKEIEFRAALWFRLTPRIIDYSRRRSCFAVSVGLPWWISDRAASPTSWSECDRQALWASINAFLKSLIREENPHDLWGKVVKKSKDTSGERCRFERFEAFYVTGSGISYVQKSSIPPLDNLLAENIAECSKDEQGPPLDVFDNRGNLDPMVGFKVFAVMTHPSDEDKRREVIAKAWLNSAIEEVPKSLESAGLDDEDVDDGLGFIIAGTDQYSGMMSRDVLEAILTGPSIDAALKQMNANAFDGAVAGDMLLFMLSCSIHNPEHMSFRKAAFIVSRTIMGSKDQAGNGQNCGESTMKMAWGRFKTVAHLWAAYRLWELDCEKDPRCSPFEPEGLITFLAMAEELRRFGTSSFAHSQKEKNRPILDPATTWRTPSRLILPSVTFSCDPLPPEVLKQLRKYRARKPPKPRRSPK